MTSGYFCPVRKPLVLVAPKQHTLFQAQPAKLDLSGERLLLLKEGHCFRDDMLIACRRGGAEMVPVFESDHFESISVAESLLYCLPLRGEERTGDPG